MANAAHLREATVWARREQGKQKLQDTKLAFLHYDRRTVLMAPMPMLTVCISQQGHLLDQAETTVKAVIAIPRLM